MMVQSRAPSYLRPILSQIIFAQESHSWDAKTVLINYVGERAYVTFSWRSTDFRLIQHDKQNIKIARYVFLLDVMKVNNEAIISQR
jgi:hypothetical protein